jgi:hypothetical protein
MAILFITVDDVVALEKVSVKTAYKRLRDVIQHFDLPKRREVSLKAYCKRHLLSEKQVNRIIEANRAKLKLKSA